MINTLALGAGWASIVSIYVVYINHNMVYIHHLIRCWYGVRFFAA